MAEKIDKEIKIFSLNRIKFLELYHDALTYIKASYNAIELQFTTASPFGLLLLVVLHLGRMIFYYIEDSISGLNIRTAYRPDQVRGLAMLAGHDAARPIASRGAILISFYDTGNTTLNGNVCYIPNKTKIISKLNGYTYTILLGADNGKITMNAGNYLDATIILGEIKMLSATGTGEILQSFNFAERNYAEVDQYYVNIYVNGESWEIVSSLMDLGFKLKGCIVRTGINSGLDIFFGNGLMGAIPEEGSSIIVEYCVCAGTAANLAKEYVNSGAYWQIDGKGMLLDGTQIDLDTNFRITCTSNIIFGSESEDIGLTLLIAPHTSRAFVLANETNYRYFFKRMNMFSDVEIIRGSSTKNGSALMQLAYDEACDKYNSIFLAYKNAVDTYGESSLEVEAMYSELEKAYQLKLYTGTKLTDNSHSDNTVYIFLVPDITKRISGSLNYFSCDESLFYLSEDELENILNLILASGQLLISVENKIVLPKVVRFAVNVQAKIWDNYNEDDVYTAGLQALSDYLINYARHDIIPVSDIVSIFENKVAGIDSVKVTFDADVNNELQYGTGNYGLDEYGDIILTRTITKASGETLSVRDIMPLIRGGFTGISGAEYSAEQTKYGLSAFNLTITGKSSNRKVNLSKYTALT